MTDVGFLYNAQSHHILHSLPIACELSRLYADYRVVVLARSEAQLALARSLAAYYPGHRLHFETLAVPAPLRLPKRLPGTKSLILLANRRRLASFDALVVPERTSLRLKRYGITRPKFIHTFHGSSGHDRIDDPRLGLFDLLLAPSAKRLDRLTGTGSVRLGHAAVIGYSKLDLVRRIGLSRPPLFANDLPIVLYNPHHGEKKSSWFTVGRQVLEHFAKRTDYNFIFAPHIRLFDPPERKYEAFRDFMGLKHMIIDLGSDRSIDMTYTSAADVYLGDISSQVFEFIVRPRPCIFLNPQRLAWQNDPDFASWQLGPVIERLDDLGETLATRAAWQPAYAAAQQAAAAEAFPEMATPAPTLGAHAIARFLRNGELRSEESDGPHDLSGAA